MALYMGLPYDLSEDRYLPKPAGKILESSGELTEEQKNYVQSHLVDVRSK